MNYQEDGSVLSGATRGSRGYPSVAPAGPPATGIVIAFHAYDEPGNVLELPTVDVILPRYGLTCNGVLVPWSGAANSGEAFSLSPCTTELSTGKKFCIDRWDEYDLDQLDGDRVVVEWLDGDQNKPFVHCVLPSRAAQAWFPKYAQGDVQLWRHRGTEIRIDNIGGVTIDTTQSPKDDAGRVVPGNAPSRIVFNVRSDADLEVNVGGRHVLVQQNKVMVDAQEIDLGDGADQRIPLGDALITILNTPGTFAMANGVIAPVHPLNPDSLLSSVAKVKK